MAPATLDSDRRPGAGASLQPANASPGPLAESRRERGETVPAETETVPEIGPDGPHRQPGIDPTPARVVPEIRPARLAARGIAFGYAGLPVLDDVSFDVAPGEVFGFLGPNGAGKSSLLSILAGLREPSRGTFQLDGRTVAHGSRELRVRTGVVFQEPSLDPKLTARENLLLAATLFRIPRALARARAEELLAAAGLRDRADEPVARLSSGMRRRVELARATIQRPAILLMDEPTTGLDAAAFRRTWEALLALRDRDGLTIVLATHRPEEAERCERLAVLSHGRIVACETPEALRSRVRGDVVVIEADEPQLLAREIERHFRLPTRAAVGVGAAAAPGTIAIERERGHELVPRLVEAFPAGRFRSVSVRRPSLADAFLAITGQTLEGERSGEVEEP